MTAAGEPIPIPCEGSNTPAVHGFYRRGGVITTICPMCGEYVPTDDNRVPPHVRDDILARLTRGDFE